MAGAHVLLTDLPTLVSESLIPNLERNQKNAATTWGDDNDNTIPPEWMTTHLPTSSSLATDDPKDHDHDTNTSSRTTAIRIGSGWVATAALDWTKPLQQQLSNEQCQVDLIVACDCVWLWSMLQGLLTTVETIFHLSSRSPKLLLSFQRRDPVDTNNTKMFTTVDQVIEALRARKWSVECLAWHPVGYYQEEDGTTDFSKEVFLLECGMMS
jgi:Lysine methyltransferase